MIKNEFLILRTLYLEGHYCSSLYCKSTVAKADDDKSKSKPKKETKYDRLFKDKKTETARSKFITVHKLDNKIYLSCHVLC